MALNHYFDTVNNDEHSFNTWWGYNESDARDFSKEVQQNRERFSTPTEWLSLILKSSTRVSLFGFRLRWSVKK